MKITDFIKKKEDKHEKRKLEGQNSERSPNFSSSCKKRKVVYNNIQENENLAKWKGLLPPDQTDPDRGKPQPYDRKLLKGISKELNNKKLGKLVNFHLQARFKIQIKLQGTLNQRKRMPK